MFSNVIDIFKSINNNLTKPKGKKETIEAIDNVFDALAKDCNATFGYSTCPAPHLKFKAIDGSGRDYIWLTSAGLQSGTLQQFKDAVAAL